MLDIRSAKGISKAVEALGIIIMIMLSAFFLVACSDEEEATPPVIQDYSLPNAPVREPQKKPSPTPTEAPEVMTL